METLIVRLDALLETPELAALGPAARDSRKSVADLDSALGPAFHDAKYSPQQQSLMRALVFLWHDHLEEAHSLSQNIPTADGSFVHGIMHRREPDYGNAKYWLHRAGSHPAFKDIARRAAAIPASASDRALLGQFCRNEKWDAFVFIDCCQQYNNSGSGEELFLRRAQKSEFSGLLGHLALL